MTDAAATAARSPDTPPDTPPGGGRWTWDAAAQAWVPLDAAPADETEPED